jgi:undecaprenyl pyrophosphate phosphatase UppP
MDNAVVILVTVAALLAVVVWFDSRLLADLAGTPDHELRYFNRNTWALIIVLSFPVGPMLYLRYAKSPGRYR